MLTWKSDGSAVVFASVNVATVGVAAIPSVALKGAAVAAMAASPTARVKAWASGPLFRWEPVVAVSSVTVALRWIRPVKPAFGVMVTWPLVWLTLTVAFAVASVMVTP